jgi:hypothetical protein
MASFLQDSATKFIINSIQAKEPQLEVSITNIYKSNPQLIRDFAPVLAKFNTMVQGLITSGGKRKHTRRTRRVVKHV